MKSAESKSALTYFKEETKTALSNLFGWGKKKSEEKKAPAAQSALCAGRGLGRRFNIGFLQKKQSQTEKPVLLCL